MLPFFDPDMGGERNDLIKWFLEQNEKIDAISTGKAEVSKPPLYGDNERGRALMHGVEAYAKLRVAPLDPVINNAEGHITPLSQRFNPEQKY